LNEVLVKRDNERYIKSNQPGNCFKLLEILDCVFCFEVEKDEQRYRGTCTLIGELFTSVFHVFESLGEDVSGKVDVKISKDGSFKESNTYAITLDVSRGNVTSIPIGDQKDAIF